MISTSRDGYELRYFQIGNEADDDEEDNEWTWAECFKFMKLFSRGSFNKNDSEDLIFFKSLVFFHVNFHKKNYPKTKNFF